MEGFRSKKIKVVDIVKKPELKKEPALEKKQKTKEEPARPEFEFKPEPEPEYEPGPEPKREFRPEPKEKTQILEAIIEKEIKEEKKPEPRIEEPIIGKLIPKKRSLRFYVFTGLGLVVLLLAGYLAVSVLPRAEIRLVAKRSNPDPWTYENPVRINPKIVEIDSVNKQIPAAIFSQSNKNLNISWPATGKKNVERKASGKITIWNEYGSDPQTLVNGTRFETPDGKIFRIQSRVVIPGAKVENGKVVPSSIDADVIADKAGDSYNIGPVQKFTIPGFKDTSKYEKFYGQSKNPMAGGFVGEAAYPTESDIIKAKAAAESQIKSAIETFLYTQANSEDFKLIDGTNQFNVSKEVVNKDADNSGNFSVFIEASGSVQAFKESSLLDLMAALSSSVIGRDFKLKDYHIDYSPIQTDSKTQMVILPIKFSGEYWKLIDVEDFKSKVASKSETELKTIIFSSSNIEKADISFWPFWVSKVPGEPGRIKVSVE